MEENAPIYKIKINYDDETGMLRNSFVEHPAVEYHKINFSKPVKQVKFSENKSEQKFMGVSLLADTPIERRTPNGELYYLLFEKESVKMIINKLSMEWKMNEISFQHDESKIIDGVYLVECFFLEKGRVECPPFAEVPEGSCITTYWVKDSKQYEELLSNPEFNGFSIEINAYFEEAFSKTIPNKNNKLSEILNGIDILFDSISDEKERAKAITNYLKTNDLI